MQLNDSCVFCKLGSSNNTARYILIKIHILNEFILKSK